MSGSFRGSVKITPYMEKYVKFFDNQWFVGDSHDQMDMTTACNRGDGKHHKICIYGMVLTYNPVNGYFSLQTEDFNVSKATFPDLTPDMIDSLIAHAEWPADHIFQMDTVIGYLPCNVKWSNALRFDRSKTEGACLHFTASSKGTIFVIFAAVPNNKNTWYYVQISTYGVGIFKVGFDDIIRFPFSV